MTTTWDGPTARLRVIIQSSLRPPPSDSPRRQGLASSLLKIARRRTPAATPIRHVRCFAHAGCAQLLKRQPGRAFADATINRLATRTKHRALPHVAPGVWTSPDPSTSIATVTTGGVDGAAVRGAAALPPQPNHGTSNKNRCDLISSLHVLSGCSIATVWPLDTHQHDLLHDDPNATGQRTGDSTCTKGKSPAMCRASLATPTGFEPELTYHKTQGAAWACSVTGKLG